MSTIKQYSGVHQGFLISLQLKDSNVLQIFAENNKTYQVYSLSFDKPYLQKNSQFLNIIDEPAQILDFFKRNSTNILFNKGQLILQYLGFNQNPESISIHLFKQRSLANLYRALGNQQLQTQKLKTQNQNQKSLFQKLSNTIDKISQKINDLFGKNAQFNKKIQILEGKDCSLSQRVQNLQSQHNSNYDQLIKANSVLSQLQKKNKQFCEEFQKNKEEHKLRESNDASLQTKLQSLIKKHNELCDNLKKLKLEDQSTKEKVDFLIKQQDIDQSYHSKIDEEIKLLQTRINLNQDQKYKILDQKIIDHKKELGKTQTKIFQNVADKINKFQINYGNVTWNHNKLKEQLEYKDKQMGQKIRALQNKYKSSEQRLKEKYDQIIKERNHVNRSIIDIQKHLSNRITNEVSGIQKKYLSISQQIQNQGFSIRDLKLQKDNVQKIHQELRQLDESFQRLEETSKTQNAEQNRKIQGLQTEFKEKIPTIEANFKDLKQKMNNLITDGLKKLDNLESKDNQFEQTIECLNNRDKQFQEQLVGEKININQKLKRSVQALKQELQQYKNKINEQELRINSQVKQDIAKLFALLQKKAPLTQFNDSKKKTEQLEIDLQKKIDTINKQINSIKNGLPIQFKNTIQNKLSELRQNFKQQLLKQINQQKKTIKDQSSKLDDKIKEINDKCANHQNAITQFTEQFKKTNQFSTKIKEKFKIWNQLGSHPLNKNSEIFKTLRKDYRTLYAQKQQTKDTAYNFVNIYEIKPKTSMKYNLKIISEGKTKVFIAFSNLNCLASEAQSSKQQSWLASWFCNKEYNVNQSAKQGRCGKLFELPKYCIIQCSADLIKNQLSLKPNDGSPQFIHPTPAEFKDQSLYLEIACLKSIKFDLYI